VDTIATRNNAVNVTFLYVVPPLNMPLVKDEFKSHIESVAKSAAEDYVKRLIGRLKYRERAYGKVVTGKAADSILDYATENKMDIMVMSSHGLSGIGRWVRGSVADKVLHESKIPILRIRSSAPRSPFYIEGQKMTVLVPLDGSELAETVLDHVRGLTKQFGTQSVDIVLLRVCEMFSHPHHHYPPTMPLTWEEYLKYETKRCKQICLTYLSGVRKRLKKEGLNVRLGVPVGNPAEAIVEYVDKNPVSLIVLSTHGHTGVGQWAFANVANKVMRRT